MIRNNLANACHNNKKAARLTQLIINACEDAKANEILALDISELLNIVDQIVIVSGKSDRHVLGICNRVVEMLERAGIKDYEIEGRENAQWILIDCGDVVLHIFYETTRHHYDLDGLWMRGGRIYYSPGGDAEFISDLIGAEQSA